VSREGRVGVGEQEQPFRVVVEVGVCLAVLVIVDMDIQTYDHGSNLVIMSWTSVRKT
jgi:hypothetical protein